MTDAATFLAQAIPWPDGNYTGYVNIHSPFTRPGTDKAIWPGHAFTQVDPALDNVAWRVRKDNDIYACMSLQSDAYDLKPGKNWRGAMRAAERAVALKSFWLDADTKLFAGEQDLLTKFGVFRRKVGLPVPSIINWSGGGAHFFWVLPSVILPAEWHGVAAALAEACRREGFEADHQCTVNPAQLMRIPGTVNHKYTPPRPAHTFHLGTLVELDDIKKPLEPYKTAYRRPVTGGTPRRRLSLPPGSRASSVFDGVVLGPPLGEGIDLGQPTSDQVADACPWWKHLRDTRGRDAREPEWFESLKVAYHCKGGPIIAQQVSSLHPDYDPGATEEKYNHAAVSAEQYGWPQCHTIQSSGATQCANCPHVNEGKSPLNFAIPDFNATAGPSATAAALIGTTSQQQSNSAGPAPGPIPGTSQTGPTIRFMPTGYRYDTAGFIEHLIKSEDKKSYVWDRMYPVRVNGFVRQNVNKEMGYGKEMMYFQYEDVAGFKLVQLTAPELHDARRLRDVLSKQGMGFKDYEAQNMGRFMVSFIQQLRAAPHLSVECEPYGWSLKGGVEDAFTFDGTRFNCNGNRQIAPPDINLGNKYKATGDLDIWKQACRLITDQQRPDLDAIVACALGAPLVQMTGHNGFVVSAYSTATGVQKTAAMRVGHSVWGDPNSMAGLDDTNNYLNMRLASLRHLPLYVDELKFADDLRKAEVMVLGITQGKSKGRLTRESATMETFSFNTMMITASNASLVDHIGEQAKTTTAGMARIFEFAVERNHGVGMVDSGVAQSLIGRLASNYGTAGRVYAEFLGQNVARVRADVLNMTATINGIVNGTPDERFWVAAIAVLIVGATYGNELQLTNIGIDKLSRFLLDQFKKQRGDSAVSTANIGTIGTVERYVSDFINGHPQQTIKTDVVDTSPGRGTLKPVVLNDVNSIMGLSRGISIHAVRDNRIVRISAGDFGKWLVKEHRVSKHAVIKKVKELLPCKEVKLSIGRGTVYKRTPETVLEFDTTLMPSIDLFN